MMRPTTVLQIMVATGTVEPGLVANTRAELFVEAWQEHVGITVVTMEEHVPGWETA